MENSSGHSEAVRIDLISAKEAARLLDVPVRNIYAWARKEKVAAIEREGTEIQERWLFEKKVITVIAAKRSKGFSSIQVAKFLCQVPSTINRWAKTGRLLAIGALSPLRFDRKAVDNMAAALSEMMSTAEVAEFLDVSPDKVRRWVQVKKLPAAEGGRGLKKLFDRRTVEEFAAKRAKITAKEASLILGVPVSTIHAWTGDGGLTCIKDARAELFVRKEVEAIAATRAANATAYIPASEAARIAGVDQNSVLRWAYQEKVPAIKISGHWFFDPKAMEAVAAKFPPIGMEVMSTKDAAILLKVDPKTILNMEKAGDLQAYSLMGGRTGKYFEKSAVEALAATYRSGMSTEEVADYLEVNVITVVKWEKKGILRATKSRFGRRFEPEVVKAFAATRILYGHLV